MNLQFLAENVFVISLVNRQDRRKKVSTELKNQKISFQFYDAIADENPIYGCTASHINVIKIAKEKKLPYVLIFEDDAQFVRPFKLPVLPESWDMLFLGGCVNKIYDEYYYSWKKCSNWYAHAYIVKASLYDRIIEEASQNMDKRLIDEYYCEYLHPHINSYCLYPTMVTQGEDYSDILKTNLDRHQKVMNFDKLVEMKNPNPPQFPEIYCINLKERNDRYEYMNELFRKNNLKVTFYRPERNTESGAVGCRESHLAVLKEAKKRGLPNVLIFEDDIDILDDIRFSTIPNKWDMFYLGGNWVDILDKSESDHYCKIRSWSTYAYAVSAPFFDTLIKGLSSTEKEIDRYYLENIHPNYNCYMAKPQLVVPSEKFQESDIMGKEMDYSFLRESVKLNLGEKNVSKPSKLKIKELKKFTDDDLPTVSIITPTRNRPHFMKLAVYNFYTQNYPKDKLEWIIIDESNPPVKEHIPADERIKYYHIKDEDRKFLFQQWTNQIRKGLVKPGKTEKQVSNAKIDKVIVPHKMEYGDFYKFRLPIGMKRNMGVNWASNRVIVHMDDDDFYPIHSVRLRVDVLLQTNKPCVSCSAIANFNICKMISMINVPPYDMSYEKRTSEASLAYYKTFWEKQRYEAKAVSSEGESFLKGRTEQVVDVDWNGIIISLRHSGNISNRNELTEEPNGWHFGTIDDKLFLFLTSLDEPWLEKQQKMQEEKEKAEQLVPIVEE